MTLYDLIHTKHKPIMGVTKLFTWNIYLERTFINNHLVIVETITFEGNRLDFLNRVRTGSPINNGTVYNLDRYIIFLSLVIIKIWVLLLVKVQKKF